ncbi:MAG TPA: Usg family protein [Stellaceae bacterium]|jgi:uncharacterized protein Usg
MSRCATKVASVNRSRLEFPDYRLTTAEIIYRLPDRPQLLQSFVWQHLDAPPEYPVLRRFLEFWVHNIEGRLHSVKVAEAPREGSGRLRHVSVTYTLH